MDLAKSAPVYSVLITSWTTCRVVSAIRNTFVEGKDSWSPCPIPVHPGHCSCTVRASPPHRSSPQAMTSPLLLAGAKHKNHMNQAGLRRATYYKGECSV